MVADSLPEARAPFAHGHPSCRGPLTEVAASHGVGDRGVVLRGLHAPDERRMHEQALGNVRLWSCTGGTAASLSLIPDLSRDVVLTSDGSSFLTSRTSTMTQARWDGSAAAAGVRLPISATSVAIDRTWSGWTSRRPVADRLTDAVVEGVITWSDDPVVAGSLTDLGATVSVGDIARRLFMAERTLRRRFVAATGVGPTYVRRVLRLHRLAHSLSRGSTADAAVAAGFVDQSHAARDVASLTGMRLGQFARWRLAE